MTTPKPLNESPLRVEQHVFQEIHLSASEMDEPRGGTGLRTSRTVRKHDTDERRFLLTLTVEIDSSDPEQPAPYAARLVVSGYFEVADTYPLDRAAQLVEITGASILYGACREMLINLTARAPHGQLSLPSVSFIETAEDSGR
jgi:preprotein translocase subunit SecB